MGRDVRDVREAERTMFGNATITSSATGHKNGWFSNNMKMLMNRAEMLQPLYKVRI